jgi:hypothetical protein
MCAGLPASLVTDPPPLGLRPRLCAALPPWPAEHEETSARWRGRSYRSWAPPCHPRVTRPGVVELAVEACRDPPVGRPSEQAVPLRRPQVRRRRHAPVRTGEAGSVQAGVGGHGRSCSRLRTRRLITDGGRSGAGGSGDRVGGTEDGADTPAQPDRAVAEAVSELGEGGTGLAGSACISARRPAVSRRTSPTARPAPRAT